MERRARSEGRRHILKRGALGVASVAAVAVTGAAASASTQRATPASDGAAARMMRLVGRGWHADAPKASRPGKGERFSVYGELYATTGEKVGEFFSENVGVDSPFQLTGEGRGAFEIHTLTLAGGTIVGVGMGGGGERSYAIVGGTGRYTGARGSYVARQDIYGLGGDGKAELLLTLLD